MKKVPHVAFLTSMYRCRMDLTLLLLLVLWIQTTIPINPSAASTSSSPKRMINMLKIIFCLGFSDLKDLQPHTTDVRLQWVTKW